VVSYGLKSLYLHYYRECNLLIYIFLIPNDEILSDKQILKLNNSQIINTFNNELTETLTQTARELKKKITLNYVYRKFNGDLSDPHTHELQIIRNMISNDSVMCFISQNYNNFYTMHLNIYL
jgi:hypothetical protein